MLFFDIEADDLLNPTVIHCVSIWDDVPGSTGPVLYAGEKEVTGAVARLMMEDSIVAHNGVMFDVPTIERLYDLRLPKCHDTLIWSRFVYPDRYTHPCGEKKSNSIEAWGRFFGIEKLEHTDWTRYSDEMGQRCRQDVVILKKVYEYLAPKVKGFNFALKLEHRVAQELYRQVRLGVGFDLIAAERLAQQFITERAGIDDEFRVIFPPRPFQLKTKIKMIPFNPGSRPQFAERLIEKYGWEPTLRTETGAIQMDEQVVSTLEWPEARLMERRMLLEKLTGQLDSWIAAAASTDDGRVHGWVNGIGAVTHRMSHSDPNMAQVPRVGSPYGAECRSLFLPSSGKVMVGADLSGIELRLFANRMWPFDDGKYSELVVNGDPHTFNQKAAGLDTRQQAKNGIYCLMYGGGDEKLGNTVGKPDEGKKVRNTWMGNIPAMKQTIDAAKAMARQHGYVVLLDGRRAPVRKEYMALNTQIQGDAAVLHKMAMVLACYRLRGKADMLLNVHDELQFEADPGEAEAVGRTIVGCMEEAGRILKVKTPITGEFRVGKNWKETH